MRGRLFVILLLFFFRVSNAQELKIPAIFSDNMVLQQKSNVPVWGWDAPGKVIQVTGSWNNKTEKAITDNTGKWMLKLSTPSAGGPFTLIINGEKSIAFQNVMIGEVWICSGQSNMEMPMSGWGVQTVQNSENFIKQASDYPNIRLFNEQRKIATTPQSDCSGHWVNSSSESVATFSAAGYFFGLELYKRLNIPVGLIMTTWGGTPSEAWTSAEEISKYSDFKSQLAYLTNHDQHITDSIKFIKDLADWQSKLKVENNVYQGDVQKWMSQSLVDSTWTKIAVPEGWQNDSKLQYFTGMVWFRKTIEIPKEWEGKDLSVEFGIIDEMDMCWMNDYKLGEQMVVDNWDTPRKYILPAEKVKAGFNTIAIRMINTQSTGGILGPKTKLKVYPVKDGDIKAISLAGEWKYKIDIDQSKMPAYPLNRGALYPYYPSVLFNGMINPLIPFAVKGAIWYQGESNVNDAKLYGQIFPAMVKCWRSLWNQGDFPFYYVQIAPFDYGSDAHSELLREAQLKSLKTIPNSGMAVTMDIGTIKGIHPPNKEAVGKRLANWALAMDYGIKDLTVSGPIYTKMMIEDQEIRLYFDYAKKGLEAIGGELTNFEIAGNDHKFFPAMAVIENNTVVVSNFAVPEPVAVRYGWSNTATPNLFNTEGLPASPFRTDNWDK